MPNARIIPDDDTKIPSNFLKKKPMLHLSKNPNYSLEFWKKYYFDDSDNIIED